ncbi:Oligopeptide transport ATP-binding protein OppF [Methanosarcina sp. MTP4]|uniref:ATP-binding cassette domain-containing protein n=1 Tax=Methanosarcina sp. MTP4 TaxID=1434100 RepID=UPI00061587CC|nr:ABC transporter ATP-binding protein [Methanosarcina sp. MTP4]AKB23523.1 Oligopeptide transport ATP-binding protein OppF [Methanosarcina sp. MTP4]
MLEVKNLEVSFSRGMVKKSCTRAVDDVSFQIRKGETFGLVGESGSGKTTLGKALLQLVRPSAGTICFKGTELTKLKRGELKQMRPRMQMIFQDPQSSLDPRMKVRKSIEESLKVRGYADKRERSIKIQDLLSTVGLNSELLDRYPYQLSGGQNQRIVLSRVLALEPEFIVADEPTSALDISVQAQILNLLKELKKEYSLTLLFISHDLEVVRHMSDRIAVMHQGKIVEIGTADDVFEKPENPYTKTLLFPEGEDFQQPYF